MSKEIERKYVVRGDGWRGVAGAGTLYRQGYLAAEPERSVRVRVAGDRAVVTIKGASRGIERDEFEYPIPGADAEQILEQLCLRPLIVKTRYTVKQGSLEWEIDEFESENRGLVLAEVELDDAGQRVEKPEWVGDEVTGDPRYFNMNLARRPYSCWGGR